MESKNILVIGEAILDKHIYCEINRLDPAGPWPVLKPKNIIENPGGAANVVANIKSLAGDYKLNLFFLRPFETITKTRYVCEKTNHHFCRVDENDLLKESLYSSEQFFNYCNSNNINWSKLDCIVISSYNKGFLTKNFISEINGLALLHNIPVFVDCKFDLGSWSKDIFCIKINEKEYSLSDSILHFPENYCQNLIVTLGDNGAILKNKKITFPLEKKVEIFSLCGAGDSFLSALVINYLETNNLENAIKWANKVCSYKVTQKGVIAVKRKDIIN